MLLRSVTKHVKAQNWTAVALDFVIVVVGVFIGIQVANWNDARVEDQRREQIVNALAANFDDAIAVQKRFRAEIDDGLSAWEDAFARGGKPPPFYYRLNGSDTAPDTWSTFEQMQLTDLFDPVTLFDLSYFYSELDGVGRKYIRYVTFVENEILPGLIIGEEAFYDETGQLRPKFQANMDRLREYVEETNILTEWARCLGYRLEAKRTFVQSCRRANYRLDGMSASAIDVAASL